MKNTIKLLSAGTISLGLSLSGSSVYASNAQMVQAATGYPFLGSGEYDLATVDNNERWFTIKDGRSIYYRSAAGHKWITPVAVRETDEKLYMIQKSYTSHSDNKTMVKSRVCSFGQMGEFYSCSGYGTMGQVKSVTVPLFGMAYSQTYFKRISTNSQYDAELYGFRFYNK